MYRFSLTNPNHLVKKLHNVLALQLLEDNRYWCQLHHSMVQPSVQLPIIYLDHCHKTGKRITIAQNLMSNVLFSFVLCCAFKIFTCTKMFVKDYLKHLLNLGSSALFQSHDCLVTYLRFRGILIKFQGVISFTLLNFVLLLNVPLYMYNPEKLHVISRGLIL